MLNEYKKAIVDQARIQKCKHKYFGRPVGLGFGEFIGNYQDLGNILTQNEETDTTKRDEVTRTYQNMIEQYENQYRNFRELQLD